MGPATIERLEVRQHLAATPPQFDHLVIVVEENHSYGQIVGNPRAPYLNHLRTTGASLTHFHAVTHPSQPNYLDLFSGSAQGIKDDKPPTRKFAAPNLGGELIAAGLRFAGYSESMPKDGYEGVSNGAYHRRHNPWVNFSDVPKSSNLRFSQFPHTAAGYKRLPTVSIVVPDLNHDMHDGSIASADRWARTNLDGYAKWATQYRSLLIVTWDEDDDGSSNHVPTFIVGASVKQGRYDRSLNHFSVLRTIEEMYRLPLTGAAATARPITDSWEAPSATPLSSIDATPRTEMSAGIAHPATA